MRALTPQSAQRISLSGPVLKPCDRLLIVISKFLLSFSSHVAEPFSAHTGHVTDMTNRSRLYTTASRMEPRLTNNGQIGRRFTAIAAPLCCVRSGRVAKSKDG